MHQDTIHTTGPYRSFCELQEDWVLMTSSRDQPLRKKDAIRKIRKTNNLQEVERTILNIRKAGFRGRIRRSVTTRILRRKLQWMGSNHPWSLWEAALAHFEKGRTGSGNEWGRKAIAASRNDLSLVRHVNQVAPRLLRHETLSLSPPPARARIAVVIPGGLRCWPRNAPLLTELRRHCDVFVCTSPEYAHFRDEMQGDPDLHVKIVEDDPKLPENAMQQWMRLNTCLNMVQSSEQEKGVPYTHIVKLRTDYYFMDPTEMLAVIGDGGPGLTACSDKIFAGDRDTMMLFREFFNGILDYHVDRDHWFPLNTQQVMRSADSYKWFGLLFPEAMLKGSRTPAAFRSIMMDSGPEPAGKSYRKIMNGQAGDHPEGRRLMHTLYDISPRGKKVFASEICFAAFLNRMDVTVAWKPCLSGVLWQDRSEDPGTGGRPGENRDRSYPENTMKD